MTREGDAARHESAPADSWQRFNQDRGSEARGSSTISHTERTQPNQSGHASFSNEGSREDARTAGNTWSRFSSERGNVSTAANERGSYSRGESYSRDSYGSSYGRYSSERNPYPSYSRGSQPSYSHASQPSYSRASYPSYSRGNAEPSYSRGSSQPSYSRASYPSYSRGNAEPSYSRGSSQPSYSHGGSYSAPHPSGGSRGEGGGSHGGGRPPQ